MIDYHTKLLRQPGPPKRPILNKDCCIKFKENRDKFVTMLKEALKARHWNVNIFISFIVISYFFRIDPTKNRDIAVASPGTRHSPTASE